MKAGEGLYARAVPTQFVDQCAQSTAVETVGALRLLWIAGELKTAILSSRHVC